MVAGTAAAADDDDDDDSDYVMQPFAGR